MGVLARLVVVAAAPILFAADSQGNIGSQACAVCHGDVSKKYAATAMAHASGSVGELHLPDGAVAAAQAGATFRILSENGRMQLSFGKRMPDGTAVEGSKNLSYYIGSGAHARGFIFDEQGQPFQAPVAYYGQSRGFDLAPGYENEKSILLSRKIEPGCLNCHASGLQTSTGKLFQEGAVACERCHGPGESHVALVQSGKRNASLNVVNPLKLQAENRDSICAQCHLTGEARIAKAGRSETSFRPGDRLSEHVVPFIRSTPDASELKVIGHFEGLWQSRCKRVSGDKLSCLTCHDPHSAVPAAEKVTYYRQKCLTCHQEASCKLSPAARSQAADSCIACHMPTRASTDGQHTAFTDHSIQRSRVSRMQTTKSDELIAFWPKSATARDYALAYADEAWLKGDAASVRDAQARLAAALPASANDGAVEAQLGYTYDLAGEAGKAQSLYRQALENEPENLLALTNLGTHLAQEGRIREAIELWTKALLINPGLKSPGLNRTRAEMGRIHFAEARQDIRRMLSLNPDSEPGLELEKKLQAMPAN